MNGTDKEARKSGSEGEELPPSDGTCDACEPDEAQQAAQLCATCRFAFCAVHAEKHQRSTRHSLAPYAPKGEEPGPTPVPECHGEGARGGERKEGVAGGSGDGGNRVEAEEEEEEEERPAAQEGGRSRETVTVERLRCVEHGQDGTLYCKNDEKIVCVVCAVQGAHRTHEIITLREAYMWQKSRGGVDLLGSTQEMAERIKSKWTSPDMNTVQLECYVNQQFDALQRLVRAEERRTLHLVDLKEAFLTAQAAEKMAEINVHTERLQAEVDSITEQLGALDRGEDPPSDPDPKVVEARQRPEPRQDPPGNYRDGGPGSSMGHAP